MVKKILNYTKNEDNRILIKNISGSFIFKGLQSIISFIMMPIYLEYFENDSILGVWFTLLSMLNWIVFFDVGIGNGLRNNLSKSIANENYKESKSIVSSTYIIMTLICLLILSIGISVVFILDWNNLLNISKDIINSDILRVSLIVLIVSTVIHFYLKIISSILNSLRLNNIVSIVSLSSTIIMFVFVLLSKSINSDYKFVSLSVAYSLSIVVPYIVTTFVFFLGKYRFLRPNFKMYDRTVAKNVVNLGLSFFWIQITLMFINSTNQILITNILGPDVTVNYQIYFKVFNLFLTIFALVSNPIWSSISKAYVNNEFNWIIKTRKLLYLFTLIYSLGILVFIPLSQIFINLWLGENSIIVEYNKIIIFSVYTIVTAWLYSVTSVSNGVGHLKTQILWNSIGAIIKIPLSILMLLLFKDWYACVIATIVIFVPSIVFNHIAITKKINERLVV